MNRRLNDFPAVIADIPRLVKELADSVGLAEAAPSRDSMDHLDDLLVPVDEAIRHLDIESLSDERYLWLVTRLGYFLGELLAGRHHGHWMLQTNPDVDFFLRYVVTGFESPLGAKTTVDPMHIAENVLHQPPGRRLVQELGRLGLV